MFSVEETIPIGMATRRFSLSLMSVCTKARTTIGSRTAFQTSIPERGVAFQRLLPSSPTLMTGTNVETTRMEVVQHYQSQEAFLHRTHFDTAGRGTHVVSKDNDGWISFSWLSSGSWYCPCWLTVTHRHDLLEHLLYIEQSYIMYLKSNKPFQMISNVLVEKKMWKKINLCGPREILTAKEIFRNMSEHT